MSGSKRISAFTILELTLALLLSAIVFGIAYLALLTLQHRYRAYSETTAAVVKVSTLNNLLNKDFIRAKQVIKSGDVLQCSSDSSLIEYHLKDSYLLRIQSSQIDTFLGEEFMITAFYSGKDVGKEPALIDEILITFSLGAEKYQLSCRKEYDAVSLLQKAIP